MAVLFLDPLVLATLCAVVVYCWLVWRGRLRFWFGRDALWTVLAWPIPLVTMVVLLVAGTLSEALSATGLGTAGGGLVSGLIYLAAYGLPWAWLSFAPPRWLLPPWARSRVISTPSRAAAGPDGVPAVNAAEGRGHGGLSRWAWRVDGAPGTIRVDDRGLRFRALPDGQLPDELADRLDEQLDDDAVNQLELQLGAELQLEPPRGGWWTRRHLDVELDEVDELHWSHRRRGARGGLLTVRVEGRGPVHLWVTDVSAVQAALRPSRPTV